MSKAKTMAIALAIAVLPVFSTVVLAADSNQTVITDSARRTGGSGRCAWRAVFQRHSLRRTAGRR